MSASSILELLDGSTMLQHDWLPAYDCGQAVYVW